MMWMKYLNVDDMKRINEGAIYLLSKRLYRTIEEVKGLDTEKFLMIFKKAARIEVGQFIKLIKYGKNTTAKEFLLNHVMDYDLACMDKEFSEKIIEYALKNKKDLPEKFRKKAYGDKSLSYNLKIKLLLAATGGDIKKIKEEVADTSGVIGQLIKPGGRAIVDKKEFEELITIMKEDGMISSISDIDESRIRVNRRRN